MYDAVVFIGVTADAAKVKDDPDLDEKWFRMITLPFVPFIGMFLPVAQTLKDREVRKIVWDYDTEQFIVFLTNLFSPSNFARARFEEQLREYGWKKRTHDI